MTHKTTKMMTVLLFISIAVGVCSFKPSGCDLYVATWGNDTTGKGTSKSPYQTLHKASQINPSNNWTICVENGTYVADNFEYSNTNSTITFVAYDGTVSLEALAVGLVHFGGLVKFNGFNFDLSISFFTSGAEFSIQFEQCVFRLLWFKLQGKVKELNFIMCHFPQVFVHGASQSSVLIEDCTFSDAFNETTFIVGYDVTIIRSTFSTGSINLSADRKLMIDNCLFEGNTNTLPGATILDIFLGLSWEDITISNSKFINNTSDSPTIKINPLRNSNHSSSISILDCSFSCNKPFVRPILIQNFDRARIENCSSGSCPLPSCTPGSFSKNIFLTCQNCSKGEYSNTTDATECKKCHPGTISPKEASTECEPCSLGQFQPNSGHSECFACHDGTFSNHNGSTNCTLCAPNTYSDKNTGKEECKVCPQNFNQPEFGKGHCECVHAGTFYRTRENGCTFEWGKVVVFIVFGILFLVCIILVLVKLNSVSKGYMKIVN